MTTIIDRRGAGRPATQIVPECATCPGHCCKGDAIVLHPEHGDDPSIYQTEAIPHPFHGRPVLMLAHKPNGDCVYLEESGGVGRCGIYSTRPTICREFDCGRAFGKMPRAERRRMLRLGMVGAATLEQGRRVFEARARR